MENNHKDRRPYHNTALRDKLREKIPSVSNRLTENSRPKPTEFYRATNVNKIGEEGVTHILLSNESKDQVGLIFALDSKHPIHHNVLGYFASMRNFWCYVKTEERDDRLRDEVGIKLEKLYSQLTPVRVKNFYALILDALYQRVTSRKDWRNLIKKSELPFDYYSLNMETGVRRRFSNLFWYIQGCEIIRKAVKDGVRPDFSRFMENRSQSLNDYILREFTDYEAIQKHRERIENEKAMQREQAEKQAQEQQAQGQLSTEQSGQSLTESSTEQFSDAQEVQMSSQENISQEQHADYYFVDEQGSLGVVMQASSGEDAQMQELSKMLSEVEQQEELHTADLEQHLGAQEEHVRFHQENDTAQVNPS